MSFEERITALELTIPSAPKPLAAYVPAVKTGNLVYTSGQLPLVDGALKYKGKIGAELTQEEGYQAARVCVLNCLGATKSEIGSLDKVKKIVKLVAFVNSASGFNRQPAVANGASELLGEIFGEAGKHARSAVGVNELPLDAAVEVELIVEIRE